MASQIQICNVALTHCGEPSITSLNEDGKAARVLKRVYDVVLDQALTDYRWYFAIERAELAADPTAPLFGFTNRFTVPSDLLQLIGIGDDQNESKRNYTASETIFKREGNYILADDAPLKIVYVKRVTDPGMYSPEFVKYLSYLLATTIFYDLTKGADRYTALVQGREQAAKQAKFKGAIQNTPEVIVASDWIDSRFSDNYPYRIGPVV
jgi:hypothetical protein